MTKQNEYLDLALRLIRIPSETGNKLAMIDVLELVKNELPGIKFKEYESNGIPSLLFYNTPTLPKHFKVIFNAHLDVVPAKPEQYEPKVTGNKLTGRGSCDMKTGAAVEILVFKEMANKVKFPLGLQIVGDEETGGFHGTKYQIQQGVRADFVIAGEQTDLAINNLAKGVFWVKITVSGKSAHAAYLWNGNNAIANMQVLLQKIYKTFPIPKKETWRTTANVASIQTTNTTVNKVPDNCSVTIDFRYIPEDKKTIEQKLRKLLPKNAKIEILEKEPSQMTRTDDPMLLALGEAVKKVTGKVSFISKHGASDVRHYDEVGCPGACLGPIAYGLHQDDEWGDVSSLPTYAEILRTFLLSV